MAKVVVVIPTYNEKDSIEDMVEALGALFKTIKKHDMHLLYADDTSPDGTYKIVQRLMKRYKWLHLTMNAEKVGIGGAYAKAFKYAMGEMKADYVMEFDADFQHRPEDMPNLLDKIDDNCDLIIGSRYVPGGSIPSGWGFKRKFFSVVGNLICRVGFLRPSIHDFTTGYKLTKVKGILDKYNLDGFYSNSFAYKIQMTAEIAASGGEICEVPIQFMPREKGESKLIKNELGDFLKVIFLFQYNNPKMRKFAKFGTVGFIGFLVNYIGLLVFKKMPFVDSLAGNYSLYKDHPILKIFATPSSWAAAFGAEIAIISNFLLNNFWTFKEDKIIGFKKYISKFLSFNFTSVGAIIIQFVVVGALISVMGESALNELISLVIAVGIFVIPYNYFMYNVFIWKSWKLGKKKTAKNS